MGMTIEELVRDDCIPRQYINREKVKKILRSGVSLDTKADKDYACSLIDELPYISSKSDDYKRGYEEGYKKGQDIEQLNCAVTKAEVKRMAYKDGFEKGMSVLENIKADINKEISNIKYTLSVLDKSDSAKYEISACLDGLEKALEIVDKHISEMGDTDESIS